MAVLHLVNRPSGLDSCLKVTGPSDVILLLEDGVYAGVGKDVEREYLAIEADVRARGVGNRLNPKVTAVSYADFVRLVELHNPIVTWR